MMLHGIFLDLAFLVLLQVIIQVSLGGKRAHAPGDIAVIGSLSGMDPHVGLEVTLFIKGAATGWLRTDVPLGAFMRFKMYFKPQGTCVCLIAPLVGTLVRFLFHVRLQVVIQMTFGHKRLITSGHRARKRAVRGLHTGLVIGLAYMYLFMLNE
jgi:hypothetical protein